MRHSRAAWFLMALAGFVRAEERPVPREHHGWVLQEPLEVYGADNLYDYIDGGAEVYRALNVRSVVAARYVKPGAPEILADLFDMGSSSDAFGAYHHDLRDGAEAGIGQESEIAESSLSFWKGRYFVSILALGTGAEIRSAVTGLGKAVAERIRDGGAPPQLRRFLPESGLLRGQVHYFHDDRLLDRRFSIAEGNVLRLGARTEGLLARYSGSDFGGKGERAYAVLVVRYPSESEANAARRSLLASCAGEVEPGGVCRWREGTWAAARASGALLAAVLGAPLRSQAERTLDAIGRRIEGRGDGAPVEPGRERAGGEEHEGP